MDWLTSQSVWVLLVGCVGVFSLMAVGSSLAVRAFIPPHDRDAAHAIAAALMTAFAAAFAILAGLTLSNEAGYLTSAQTIVSNEASDASRLAWAATSPGVDTAEIHTALLRYLEATRTYEWHGNNAAVGQDPSTDRALANLERVVRAQAALPSLGTPASNELLSSLDSLTSDRRDRLAAAARQLPGLYVITLFLIGVALILNASVLAMRTRLRGAISVGALAIVAGLTMALLFALGTPWRGAIVVSGQPIDAVIHDLRTGYFTAGLSEPATPSTSNHP
jgi:hypothetical protein